MPLFSQLAYPSYHFVFPVQIFDAIFHCFNLRIFTDRIALCTLLLVSKCFYSIAFPYAFQVVFLKGHGHLPDPFQPGQAYLSDKSCSRLCTVIQHVIFSGDSRHDYNHSNTYCPLRFCSFAYILQLLPRVQIVWLKDVAVEYHTHPQHTFPLHVYPCLHSSMSSFIVDGCVCSLRGWRRILTMMLEMSSDSSVSPFEHLSRLTCNVNTPQDQPSPWTNIQLQAIPFFRLKLVYSTAQLLTFLTPLANTAFIFSLSLYLSRCLEVVSYNNRCQ